MHTSLSCCLFIRAEFCHHINFEAYKCFNHLTRKHSCAAWIFSYISCRLFFFFPPRTSHGWNPTTFALSLKTAMRFSPSSTELSSRSSSESLFISHNQPPQFSWCIACVSVPRFLFFLIPCFIFCLPAVLTALSCCDSNIWKLSLLLHRKNAQ